MNIEYIFAIMKWSSIGKKEKEEQEEMVRF